MNIIYCYNVNENADLGVKNKIITQIKFWRNRGHIVKSFNAWRAHDKSSPLGFIYRNIFSREIHKILRSRENNIIYIRFSFLPIVNFLFVRDNIIVLEINSNYEIELDRYKLLKRILIKIYYALLLKKSNCIIQVSKSCLNIPKYNNKIVTIGNSIECKKDDLKDISNNRKPLRRFLFLGNPNAPWHGVGKIIEIFKEAEDQYESLKIIGYDFEDLPDIHDGKIEVYGQKKSEELTALLKQCDIGIGSLNMDQLKMNYSSSLKNKEYLKHGLCVIMQGKDPDIMDLSCVYSLPMNFNNNDFWKGIESLNERKDVKKSEIYRAISTEVIETKRLALFQNLITRE